jgi:hypothetical protein
VKFQKSVIQSLEYLNGISEFFMVLPKGFPVGWHLELGPQDMEWDGVERILQFYKRLDDSLSSYSKFSS